MSRRRPSGACPHCGRPLEQPATGRPRLRCGDPVCDRAAAAERQARRLRRQQGLPASFPAQPGGGRRALLARAAARWTASYLPNVELADGDLQAVHEYVRVTGAAAPHCWLWEPSRPRPWVAQNVPLPTWQAMKELAARELTARRTAAEAERRRRLDFDSPAYSQMIASMAAEIRTANARRRSARAE